jgi:hypothetical protein
VPRNGCHSVEMARVIRDVSVTAAVAVICFLLGGTDAAIAGGTGTAVMSLMARRTRSGQRSS